MRLELTAVFILVVFNTASIKAQDFKDNCYYVTSKSGLNVRTQPVSDGQPFHVLKYGDVITLRGKQTTLDSIVSLIENDSSDWVPIHFNNIHEGFVADAYLSSNLKFIPERSIELFNTVQTPSFEYFRQENPRYYFKQYQSCFPYYENTFYSAEDDLSEDDFSAAADTISKYLSVELVDIGEYADNKVNNPFVLDQSFKVQHFKGEKGINRFFLPVNEGKDSVLVEDFPGEGYISKTYLGKVIPLNKYVIQEFYEVPSSTFIDIKTGEKSPVTAGYPHISPNGNYVVSYHRLPTYNYDDATVLSVGKLNTGKDEKGWPFAVQVGFKSWLPASEDGKDAFWVSDRELIIKVYPIDNLVNPPKENGEKPFYQYVKVTLKDGW